MIRWRIKRGNLERVEAEVEAMRRRENIDMIVQVGVKALIEERRKTV